MIEQLLTRTVTIVHRIESDDHDDFSDASDDPVLTETIGSLDQIQAREADGQGELAQVAYRLFLLPDQIIDSNDAVIVDGATYEVISDPWRVENKLTGQIHHLEVTVERTGNYDAGS